MLPIIAAPAFLFWFFKPKCARCNSKFTLNNRCIVCEELVCQKCGFYFDEVLYKGVQITPASHCCHIHKQAWINKIADAKSKINQGSEARLYEYKRRELAKNKIDKVVVYSKRYYGNKESVRLGKTVKTQYYDNKDIAFKELKIAAAMHECLIIHDLQEHSSSQKNWNYIYKIWAYSGVI